jgi:hypothetical protein
LLTLEFELAVLLGNEVVADVGRACEQGQLLPILVADIKAIQAVEECTMVARRQYDVFPLAVARNGRTRPGHLD